MILRSLVISRIGCTNVFFHSGDEDFPFDLDLERD